MSLTGHEARRRAARNAMFKEPVSKAPEPKPEVVAEPVVDESEPAPAPKRGRPRKDDGVTDKE